MRSPKKNCVTADQTQFNRKKIQIVIECFVVQWCAWLCNRLIALYCVLYLFVCVVVGVNVVVKLLVS